MSTVPSPYQWQDKRILITGGLGFIGSTLARRLVDLKADVVVLDSLIPEYGGNLFNVHGIEDCIRINISDVRDKYSLQHLVHDRDIVFNLAGQTSHLDSMHNPLIDLEINAAAQLHILEACRHERPDARIVFASTRQIYGRPQFLPINESHPINPTDVNGIHKAAGEWYHLLYNNVHGMWCTALRLTNTYGPRMRIKDARQTFLGIWIRHAVAGTPFEVWGGEQLRDFNYVEDTVDALLRAAECDEARGKAFNVGGEEVINLLDVAALLDDIAGGAPFEVKQFPPERKRIDIGDYYADDSLFRATTGWAPQVPLREGLTRTLDYYRTNLERYL